MCKKHRATLALVTASLLLVACGGSGSSSGDSSRGQVSYSLAGGTPQCSGETRRTEVNNAVSCVWNCAVNNQTTGPNKGKRGLWRILFLNIDGTWRLEDEAVSTPCP